MRDGDQATTKRVMDAMMGMTKIDIAALQKAHDQKI
jgi:predicted 3-demethylubiquinone-9 3-methyltransferase (glyoxalase superfamily)